eukprot:TRINITY_DN11153_c0_g1_i1.p1 TRINITY_DN11153_c0_g1~~TRINITY_DN11153_c0_g1_i1.p1  ORF type:complete len:286 (+),score=63.95 TRINITY_DN11153_c0_g1_i1:178-1035(+)
MSTFRNRDEPNSGLDDPELLALLTEQGINIPGKDDNNDIRDDDSGEEKASRRAERQAPRSTREPVMRKEGNTGVKGVINDYKDAKERMVIQDQIDRLKTLSFLDRHIHTVKSVNEEEEEKQFDIDELDDDDFWRKYREERMQALKNDTQKPAQVQRVVERGGNFGQLLQVTQDTFVEFVEKENPSVVIIIHLYQTHLRACTRMNECLKNLSERYFNVKFSKMISTEAKQHFDEIALPALLVYKDSKLVNVYLRMVDSVGYNFDVDDVEEFLIEEGVLNRQWAKFE